MHGYTDFYPVSHLLFWEQFWEAMYFFYFFNSLNFNISVLASLNSCVSKYIVVQSNKAGRWSRLTVLRYCRCSNQVLHFGKLSVRKMQFRLSINYFLSLHQLVWRSLCTLACCCITLWRWRQRFWAEGRCASWCKKPCPGRVSKWNWVVGLCFLFACREDPGGIWQPRCCECNARLLSGCQSQRWELQDGCRAWSGRTDEFLQEAQNSGFFLWCSTLPCCLCFGLCL